MLFLTAYAKVLKPLAFVITLMQGDKPTFLRHLVPTIMFVKCKLSQSTGRVIEPLVKALSADRRSHFQAVLSDKEPSTCLATALLSQFKLNFLPEDARVQTISEKAGNVLNYVQEVAAESHGEAQLTEAEADVAHGDDEFSTKTGSRSSG